MKDELRCGSCAKIVKSHDRVYLDTWNTVIHKKCHWPYYESKILKDTGTFGDMIDRYAFFNELKKP